MDLDPKKRPVIRHILDRLDKASADHSDETGINSLSVELQVREGKLAVENPQRADVNENSEILEDAAERLEWLHFQESQPEIGQLSLWRVQHTKENVYHHGASNSSSVSSLSTGFCKNILDILNWKAPNKFDWNGKGTLERSHFISILRKEKLEPILRSRISLENELLIQSQIIHKNIVWL
jgi:hypothetical protein